MKGCSRDEVLNAIRVVAEGKNIWDKKNLRSASRSLKAQGLAGSLKVSLSEREAEVLRQIAFGMTNDQIAARMNISCESVKVHVLSILQKIGLRDRTQAAVWALRNGLV